MTVLAGPFAAAAVLLAVGGALKVVRPDDTAVALRMAGLGVRAPAVRAGAAAEVLLGASALATGNALLVAAVAISYAAFTGFVAVALARHLPLASCGCLGGIDTPPTRLHLAINAGAAAVSAAAAVRGLPPFHEVVADQPLAGIPFLTLVALAVWLAAVAMSDLPRSRHIPSRRTQ